jgi:hypothetical protein
MMNRCYNPNAKDYLHGIKVAERWHDYEKFIGDLGKRPSPQHTLLRQDETKDFEPGNVIWWERHGKTKSRVYSIWKGILARTGNLGSVVAAKPSVQKNYLGKGIWVCDEWLTFDNFYRDMGDPPTDKHSIDRIDGDDGYYPENCRWATPKEQARNTAWNRMLTYKGETRCVSEWCEVLGLNQAVVRNRLRANLPIEKVLYAGSFSTNRGRRVQRLDVHGGSVIFDSAKEAATSTGLSYAAVSKCLSGGNATCGGYRWDYVD